ncbi:MAG: TonB-dependent receptor [Bacteroidales bacterium]|nr:TonB-dependent receptor [Bacteroidales bacterium]
MKNQFKSVIIKSLVFENWNAKNYSVFNTLKKVIKITTLSIAYSILLIPVEVLSQTDTTVTKNLDLDEVIVSAQKAPVVYSQLSRQVTVINENEIKLMPVSDINELLKNFSGIDVRQRGVNGIQSDISIRGGSFDQNLILLNGVNISDPQTGHHSLNLPIDLNSIARIEILEGPGSRVFGPNAFSGAINIITNNFNENFLKVGFVAGDFGLFSENFSGAFTNNKMKHFVSVSKSQSKGYIKNTDFDQYNAFYSTQYSSEIGKIDYQIGYTDKEFGANSFYTPAYPDQFEQTKTTFTSLKFETGERLKIIPVVYFRRHKDRFELFRYEPATWYTGHNYHLTDVYGIKIDSRLITKLGVTSFGAEQRSENIWSNVLGVAMDDTIKVVGESEGLYTKKYSRTISNYFLEHSFYYNNLSFSAGVLTSWVSENDFNYNFYPGFDLSYRFTNTLNSYITVNKSLRLPTFTDLFYNGPSNIGNINLQPEEAWSYEVGLKFQNKTLNSNFSAYYRDSKNLIAWVKPIDSDPSEKWETQNLTNVLTKGFKITNTLNFDKYWINQIRIDYNYLEQISKSENYDTKYSLNNLKHNLIININNKLWERINLSWNLRFQDRVGSYTKYDFSINEYAADQDFEPYWLCDLKLSYKYEIITVFMELQNIFNKEYVDIGNIEMPKRWFRAGFNLNFKY